MRSFLLAQAIHPVEFGLNYKLPAFGGRARPRPTFRLASRLGQRRLILGKLTAMAKGGVGLPGGPRAGADDQLGGQRHGARPGGLGAAEQ